MRSPLPSTICLLAVISWASASQAASPTPWAPPPGEYRIDSISTSRTHGPTGTIESVEEIDGATGDAKLTQKVPDAREPAVTKVRGKGPVRYCQVAAAPPPVPPGGGCIGKLSVNGDSATTSVPCQGQQQELGVQKVADGVWEKRIRVTPAASPAPRALPAQTVAAMEPVIAKMEARAKVAPPAEAASLRQQINAIKGGGSPGAGSGAPDIEIVQRWTWLSSQCTTSN